MTKGDYIANIIKELRGTTGINFQLKLKSVLRNYYRYLGQEYIMPDQYGGDDKNDGYVKDQDIYYQIYSPVRLKHSLHSEIEKKFKDDLDGLLNVLYKKKKWTSKLKEFIFIVNTIDNNLPKDSENKIDSISSSLMNKYNIEFEYSLRNLDYISDILYVIEDINVLEKICDELNLTHLINPNSLTAEMFVKLIIIMSEKIIDEFINKNFNNENSYIRVRSDKKIEINNLENIKSRIENIFVKLYIVDEAVKILNEDITGEDSFLKVKNCIIETYNNLSEKFSGIELYEKILIEVNKLLKNTPYCEEKNCVEMVVLYIFDKCDIFKKEEN